jgi:FkbM family methyltransferase
MMRARARCAAMLTLLSLGASLGAASVLEPPVAVREYAQPPTAAAAGPRHVVVELGSNRGDWMLPYLAAHPGAVPVVVEALPRFARQLQYLAATYGGHYLQNVAWSSDGRVMTFHEADAGDGSIASSVLADHAASYMGSLHDAAAPLVEHNVTSVDIVSVLSRYTAPGDHVVLRMDIEGAEYEVLRRLITSGAACGLAELHVETHALYAPSMHRFYLLDLMLEWLLAGCAPSAPRVVVVSPQRLGLPPDARRLVSPHVPGCAACPWVQEAAWGFTPHA